MPTNKFQKGLDQQMWKLTTPSANAHAAARQICCDMRNGPTRNPFVYQLVSGTGIDGFNVVQKSWQANRIFPTLAGTFGVGSAIVFLPSFGAVGTIGVGSTSASVVLSTALGQAVGLNMLANRGGSGELGFKLRVIGVASGRTEERWIVANTAGTTPTLYLDAALTFTPASGDRYEILAGRVAVLNAGTLASNIWRTYEVSTNFLSVGLSTTNLPATIGTDSQFVALDEQYVPFDHKPGEGMVKGSFVYDTGLNALAATATAAGTITGQSTLGDVAVAANEYRNFQVRIVQDTVTPAAVGQRRIIASHTAGPSAVYTLGANWTTTPSTSAKFVIEQPNLLLLRSSATTTVYTYNYTDASLTNGTNTIAAGAWSTTYFGAAGFANAVGGFWVPSFGIQPDVARLARHSMLHFWRGNSPNVDLLDIAASITGTWTSAITYDGAQTMAIGSCGAYSPFGNEGRFAYIQSFNGTVPSQMYRYDVRNRVLSTAPAYDVPLSGAGAVGNRIACYAINSDYGLLDGVFLMTHLSANCQELIPLV